MATKKATGTAEKKATTKSAAKAPAKSTAAKTPAKTASNTAGSAEKKAPTQQEIAQLAHRYWEERGRPHGSHQEDWRRAEETLRNR